MKKIITFGQHSAELHAGEHRAALVISEKCLPVGLADVLNEAGDIHVHNVQKNDDGFGCIGITHDLSVSDLIAEVCDAITRVYDTDTTVSMRDPKTLYDLRYYARRRGYRFSKTERVVTTPEANRSARVEERLKAFGYGIQLNLFIDEK